MDAVVAEEAAAVALWTSRALLAFAISRLSATAVVTMNVPEAPVSSANNVVAWATMLLSTAASAARCSSLPVEPSVTTVLTAARISRGLVTLLGVADLVTHCAPNSSSMPLLVGTTRGQSCPGFRPPWWGL